jgi:curli production assembly/transport component CsgF
MLLSLKPVLFNFLLFIGLVFWIISPTLATEMVYVPVNPSFGGNPNNAPGLMSIAQVQNGFTARVPTPLESFKLNLERAILSRLSSQTLTSIFGNSTSIDPEQIRSYSTLAYDIQVSVDNIKNTATVTTIDKTSGASTTFTVGGP